MKYDGLSILLHWLTALLVITLWALGQSLSFFPKGAPRLTALSVHMVLGLLIAAVILVRIGWRSSAGRRLPAADEGFLNLVAKGVHYGLYLLLVLTVAFGVARAWVHGLHVFNWFTFHRPAFATPGIIYIVSETHSDLADLLVIVAGMHAAAALMHHYVMRDSVLKRMLPRRDAQ
jgi:cytochrome b561